MAIAASYTMHLYCDCRQCTEGVYPVPDFGEYIGTSWAGCAKEARKDGWRISKDKTRAFAVLKESDMAIAASYTMHLYCDCRQCTEGVYPVPDFGEYIGTSWAGCAKEARKDGWRISKDKTRAFAPGHKVLRINK